eukprot:403342852
MPQQYGVEYAEKIFSNQMDFMSKARVIHSHAVVYNEQDDNLYQILYSEPGGPSLKQDQVFFNYLRMKSQCLFTSGKIFSEEQFFNFKQKYTYQDSEVIRYVKPLAFVTLTLNPNFYECQEVLRDKRFMKIVISEKSLVQEYIKNQAQLWNIDQELVMPTLLSKYNINLVGIEQLEIYKAIDYLQTTYDFKPILSEIGATSLRGEILNDPETNRVDYLYLGIFAAERDPLQSLRLKDKHDDDKLCEVKQYIKANQLLQIDQENPDLGVLNPKFIGRSIESLDKIGNQYDLLHTSSEVYEQTKTLKVQLDGISSVDTEYTVGRWLLTIWKQRPIKREIQYYDDNMQLILQQSQRIDSAKNFIKKQLRLID